ncbi:hypothetical protein DES40_1690 [Litorimonas taeanensis]|uniref:Succinate dehydrogenase subunit D n=1 Tax=Litorimonas taeanensis TaxID=568099 RepID=A0A420WD86_9PROT|nr:hypothetical protein [Litorimonas taeanensis]RKQ68915.1 hypothetical protein DES40_1690 [Litorimonas taeanensis]
MAHGKGTSHHKLHGFVGWGLIIGLPFALCCAICAVNSGTDISPSAGFISWLSSPVGALGLLAFATAAIWYCKLEMDEVIMDYFGGSLQKFGLLKNKIVAFLIWAALAYAVIKLAFL